MIKKIKFLIIFMISILLLSLNSVSATSISANLKSDKVTIKKDDEITVTMNVRDFVDIGDGTNAYVANLNFDREIFELKKAEGKNNWNAPTYNSKNISNGSTKIASTINNFTKTEGDILNITFKAKKDITSDTIISMTNISFATKKDNKTFKVNLNDIALKFTKDGTVQDKTQNNLKGKDETTSNTKLSDAGKMNFFVAIFFICVVLVFLYVKNRKFKDIK